MAGAEGDAFTIEVLERIRDAYFSLDRELRVTYVNRAAEQFWNRPREEVLGRIVTEVFPEMVGSASHRHILEALGDGRRARVDTVSAVTGTPIEMDIHPGPLGVAVFLRDVGDRRRLQEELHTRDAQLRMAEQSAGVGIWDIDLATDTVRGNEVYFRNLGLAPTILPVAMASIRPLRLGDDGERVVRGYREAISAGTDVYESEYRIRRPDGELRWIFGRGRVIRDAAGNPVRYSGIDIDVTERKAAEQALAESQVRLELAVEAVGLGIWDWNLLTGEMTWSERAKAILGFPEGEPVTVEQVRAATHPEDRQRTLRMAERALDPKVRSREPCEYRVIHADGSIRWVVAHGAARFAVEGGQEKAVRYTGTIQDVTARKEAEEHREVMLAELRHRVKNTLSIVGAMAGQTFRGVEADRLQTFQARLVALGQAYDILTEENWRSADCREVVERSLMPHRTGEGRFGIGGPPLRLAARPALALALALNELATNAIKYGSLSTQGGRVDIGWGVERKGADEVFVFRWVETGGPPVTAPEKRGFGSRLIEVNLAAEFSGEVILDWRREGFSCTLTAPWAEPLAWLKVA
jgi:PAS domain S-box-containing protein